jgi:hypothetical protein
MKAEMFVGGAKRRVKIIQAGIPRIKGNGFGPFRNILWPRGWKPTHGPGAVRGHFKTRGRAA